MQDRPTSVLLVGDEEVAEDFLLGELVEENPQHLISGYIQKTKDWVKTRELDRDDLVVSMVGCKHPSRLLDRPTCTR